MNGESTIQEKECLIADPHLYPRLANKDFMAHLTEHNLDSNQYLYTGIQGTRWKFSNVLRHGAKNRRQRATYAWSHDLLSFEGRKLLNPLYYAYSRPAFKRGVVVYNRELLMPSDELLRYELVHDQTFRDACIALLHLKIRT